MFTATITTGADIFKVKVDYERETVHPNSTHRLQDSILDDRVPIGWIICCNKKGAVTIKLNRPSPPVAGQQITTRVAPDYSRLHGWVIAPNVRGEEITWCEGWVYIPCHSKGHCHHIISILKQGKIPKNIDPHIV